MQITFTHLAVTTALVIVGFLAHALHDLLQEWSRYKNAQAMSIFKHAGLLKSETGEVDE